MENYIVALYLILYTEDLVDILVCLCNCNQKSKQSRRIKDTNTQLCWLCIGIENQPIVTITILSHITLYFQLACLIHIL